MSFTGILLFGHEGHEYEVQVSRVINNAGNEEFHFGFKSKSYIYSIFNDASIGNYCRSLEDFLDYSLYICQDLNYCIRSEQELLTVTYFSFPLSIKLYHTPTLILLGKNRETYHNLYKKLNKTILTLWAKEGKSCPSLENIWAIPATPSNQQQESTENIKSLSYITAEDDSNCSIMDDGLEISSAVDDSSLRNNSLLVSTGKASKNDESLEYDSSSEANKSDREDPENLDTMEDELSVNNSEDDNQQDEADSLSTEQDSSSGDENDEEPEAGGDDVEKNDESSSSSSHSFKT